MHRRDFLLTSASVALTGLTQAESPPAPTAAKLPRWRGFNLLEKYFSRWNAAFREEDFAWISDWGFDFVRLPLDYHCWSPNDWHKLDETTLKQIDRAVELGRQHHIHVNVNFHRAPGYCVNPPAEPFNLWKDEQALEACAYHWGHFAERYKGIPNTQVSFDLLNEPGDIREADYVRVVTRLVQAIRVHDPDRLILADGLRWGNKPVLGLVPLKIAQSTRGYDPARISHYKANWVRGSDRWPEPTWPLDGTGGEHWDKDRLRRQCIAPWQELEKRAVGIHVGEWGAHNRTPHQVVLAWMRDRLDLWKEAGWGWALWNLRGSFGVLDSNRRDVTYEDFHGHKLDRKMLELLRQG